MTTLISWKQMLRIATLGALLIGSVGSQAQQNFSCSTGRPACLNYGDKVVDEGAQCFNRSACGYGGGFVCKSQMDDLSSSYDKLVTQYNELLRNAKTLEASGNDLLTKNNKLVDDYNSLLAKYKSLATDYDAQAEELRAVTSQYNAMAAERRVAASKGH